MRADNSRHIVAAARSRHEYARAKTIPGPARDRRREHVSAYSSERPSKYTGMYTRPGTSQCHPVGMVAGGR